MSGQFTICQTKILADKRVSNTMFRVLMLLQSMMGVNGYCWPSYKYISEILGISERTAIRAIKELVNIGYVCKVKGTVGNTQEQSSNHYYINNNPDAGLTGVTNGADFGVTKMSLRRTDKNVTPNNINIFKKNVRAYARVEMSPSFEANKSELKEGENSINTTLAFWEEEELGVWREIKREMAQQKEVEVGLDKVEIIKTGKMRFIVQPSCPMYNGIKSENLLKTAERVAPQMKIEVNENKAYYLKGQVKKGSELL